MNVCSGSIFKTGTCKFSPYVHPVSWFYMMGIIEIRTKRVYFWRKIQFWKRAIGWLLQFLFYWLAGKEKLLYSVNFLTLFLARITMNECCFFETPNFKRPRSSTFQKNCYKAATEHHSEQPYPKTAFKKSPSPFSGFRETWFGTQPCSEN